MKKAKKWILCLIVLACACLYIANAIRVTGEANAKKKEVLPGEVFQVDGYEIRVTGAETTTLAGIIEPYSREELERNTYYQSMYKSMLDTDHRVYVLRMEVTNVDSDGLISPADIFFHSRWWSVQRMILIKSLADEIFPDMELRAEKGKTVECLLYFTIAESFIGDNWKNVDMDDKWISIKGRNGEVYSVNMGKLAPED